ncbi:MAG: NAD(+) synthase [Bacilli bacterium]|jgi:NAD+ synthase
MQLEQYLDQIIKWLQEIKQKNQVKGFIVGLSGGIDSAVTAFLLRKAVGDECLAVIMPCESDPKDAQDARLVAASCNIPVIEIDLTPTYQQWKSDFDLLQQQIHLDIPSLSYANTKVRLRMVTLYALATQHNYLVTGTDNWAEWYTGYFTKFGDGGVDLVPLIHLTKGEVWQAAKILGVPQTIIDRKPTAGILPGICDEDELRVTYPEIDHFLLGDSIAKPHEDRLLELHKMSEHKRNLALTPPNWKRD